MAKAKEKSTTDKAIDKVKDAALDAANAAVSKAFPDTVDALDQIMDTVDNAEVTAWLEQFREPLIHLAVTELMGYVNARAQGSTTQGMLREAYSKLTPVELAQVMNFNAEAIKKSANVRVKQAAVLTAIVEKLTSTAARLLSTAFAAL